MSEHHRLNAAEVRYLVALHAVSHGRGGAPRAFVSKTEIPPYLVEAGLVAAGRYFPTGLPRLTPAGEAWHTAAFHDRTCTATHSKGPCVLEAHHGGRHVRVNKDNSHHFFED